MMLKNLISEFEENLRIQGVESSLIFLNKWVTHRFTAIFLPDNDSLEIVRLVDEMNDASAAPLSPVPFANSFCKRVLRDGSVLTSNSVVDKRFDGNYPQGTVISDVGLQLVQQGCKFYGNLCHADYKENKIDDDESVFLQSIGGAFPWYLLSGKSTLPCV